MVQWAENDLFVEINAGSFERSFTASLNGVLFFSGRRIQGVGNIVPME